MRHVLCRRPPLPLSQDEVVNRLKALGRNRRVDNRGVPDALLVRIAPRRSREKSNGGAPFVRATR
jgi:hypothetical protein